MTVNANMVGERTAARLAEYYPFSEDVIETVSEVAQMQAGHGSYMSFLEAVGARDKLQFGNDEGNIVELIDIKPKDCDPQAAMVIHLAMANPLDPNQLFQTATVAAANPDRRIIAVGNHSGESPVLAALTKDQSKKVKSGNLSPAVSCLMKYLDQEKVAEVSHVGYSYGSDLAVESSLADDVEVKNLVLLDPASTLRRLTGRLSLALAFIRSGEPLEDYVKATSLNIFEDARKESIGMLEYTVGLASSTNRSIARYISRGKMENCLRDALDRQENAHATLVWGSQSELSDDQKMNSLAVRICRAYPERFGKIRIEGGRHAMFNDVHLQAATVAQALKPVNA